MAHEKRLAHGSLLGFLSLGVAGVGLLQFLGIFYSTTSEEIVPEQNAPWARQEGEPFWLNLWSVDRFPFLFFSEESLSEAMKAYLGLSSPRFYCSFLVHGGVPGFSSSFSLD